MKAVDGFLNGSYGVAQIAVSDSPIVCAERGRLRRDESFRFQTDDILAHGVPAHVYRPANGFIAGPALIRLAVLQI